MTDELLPVCEAPGCRIVARPKQPLCDQHAVQQRLLAARRKLAEHAPNAADALIELCENAEVPDVRRRAAEAILDRIGIRSGVEIAMSTGEVGPRASEIIQERLDLLRRGIESRQGLAYGDDVGSRNGAKE